MGRSRRTMASAKQAGRQFEHQIEHWLKWAFDDPRICRSRLHGARDIGDIINLYYMGHPVTIECKNTVNSRTGQPLDVWAQYQEAVLEAANNDSPYPVLLKKRDGVTDRDWRRAGGQLAIISEDMLFILQSNLQEPFRPVDWTTSRMAKHDLFGTNVTGLFTLINHGLPLGPEGEA
ncbi:hypothetical protein [Bifidobacterium tissieri]|uniref:hypothetical protein n=1 Tax=Bifidobacterium tissieri TaxID=1630162 RepID=UPI0012395CD6|nr:hypothetical protein [Bifidobacterium tissieri]KAA8832588.1 hypothetical protein EM849_03520 [Bifidobacterium tissieri]